MPFTSMSVSFNLIAIKLSSGTSKGATIPYSFAGIYPNFV